MMKKLCVALLVACAATSTSSAQSRSNYIPRTERGQLVANIVQRWSVEAAKKIGISPRAWAEAMEGAFGHASIEQLRMAVAARRLEDMVATLKSDARTTMEAGPTSAYRHVAPCYAGSVDLGSGKTATVDATQQTGCNIPVTASGLILQLTAHDPYDTGFLMVWPSNEPAPWTGSLFYEHGIYSDHVSVVAGTSFNILNWGGVDPQIVTRVDINILGYFEVAPVARQNCTVTAQSAAEVPDTGNKFTLAPPACPTDTQLMSVSCETGDRAARLRGNTATACSFDDVTPLDGKKGWGFAQARCCSVDN